MLPQATYLFPLEGKARESVMARVHEALTEQEWALITVSPHGPDLVFSAPPRVLEKLRIELRQAPHHG